MKVELTKAQIQALFQIVNQASILGNAAEMVVGLKHALAKAIEPKGDHVNMSMFSPKEKKKIS
jgi:hypothetical protein